MKHSGKYGIKRYSAGGLIGLNGSLSEASDLHQARLTTLKFNVLGDVPIVLYLFIFLLLLT